MTERLRFTTFRIKTVLIVMVTVAVISAIFRHQGEFERASDEVDTVVDQQGSHSAEDEARVRKLVQRFPDLAGKDGVTVWAVKYAKQETIKTLLDNGGDANDHGKWSRETPLFWAVYHDDVKLAEELIKRGGDVSVRLDMSSCPPSLLHMACGLGSLEMSKLLIDSGIDVNIPTSIGSLPLHEAVHSGNLELVRFLLDNGSDTETVDGYGLTARGRADFSIRVTEIQEDHELEAAYRSIREELIERE